VSYSIVFRCPSRASPSPAPYRSPEVFADTHACQNATPGTFQLLRHGARPDEDLDRAPGTVAATAAANSGPWGGGALHHAVAGLVRCGPTAAMARKFRSPERLGEIIEALLEAGADPCRENSSGLTALDLLLGLRPCGQFPDRTDPSAPAGGGCLGGLLAALQLRRAHGGCCSRHCAAALQRMLLVAGAGRCTAVEIQVRTRRAQAGCISH
jgi:hypothetical protein